MRKTILLIGLLGSISVFGQMKKIEASSEEIDFIASSKVSVLGEIDSELVNKNLSLNDNIFIFELQNKEGRVLYRGTINKWYPFDYSLHIESSRSIVGFCLKTNDLDGEDVMKLLESRDWKLKKNDESRYVCNSEYKIFSFDENTEKYIHNQILKDRIITKIYKISE